MKALAADMRLAIKSVGATQGMVLIEILLLACFVGVIATVVLQWVNPAELAATNYDNQRRLDLGRIQLALKDYAADHSGQYPQAGSQAGYYSCYDCGWSEAEHAADTGQRFDRNNWIPELVESGYISALPIDPLNGRITGCSSSGYIYLSGGVGYKLFNWCSPTTGLNLEAAADTYCTARPPYDATNLDASPEGHEPLKPMVDPVRPNWGYAIYTYELACY